MEIQVDPSVRKIHWRKGDYPLQVFHNAEAPQTKRHQTYSLQNSEIPNMTEQLTLYFPLWQDLFLQFLSKKATLRKCPDCPDLLEFISPSCIYHFTTAPIQGYMSLLGKAKLEQFLFPFSSINFLWSTSVFSCFLARTENKPASVATEYQLWEWQQLRHHQLISFFCCFLLYKK